MNGADAVWASAVTGSPAYAAGRPHSRTARTHRRHIPLPPSGHRPRPRPPLPPTTASRLRWRPARGAPRSSSPQHIHTRTTARPCSGAPAWCAHAPHTRVPEPPRPRPYLYPHLHPYLRLRPHRSGARARTAADRSSAPCRAPHGAGRALRICTRCAACTPTTTPRTRTCSPLLLPPRRWLGRAGARARARL